MTSSTPRALSGGGEIVVPAELAELHEKYSGAAGRVWIAACRLWLLSIWIDGSWR
jgi:hypothetical protein